MQIADDDRVRPRTGGRPNGCRADVSTRTHPIRAYSSGCHSPWVLA